MTKPQAFVDRLFWFPKESLTPFEMSTLENDLIVEAVDAETGDTQMVDLFEYDPINDFIGVPREWGMENLPQFEVQDDTVFPSLMWPTFQWPLRYQYWAGQEDAVNACYDWFTQGHYGGRLEAVCGSGKTLMSLMVASMLQTPTLVLVHKEDLVSQWHETLGKFWHGAVSGHVQGNKLEYERCHMVTAMAQTLYRRGTKIPENFYSSFGLVIFDEGHRYPARTFEKVMRLPTARHRLSISATWRRTDRMECVWNYHAGDIIHVVEAPRMTGTFKQVKWNTKIKDKDLEWKFGPYFGTVNGRAYLTVISKVKEYNTYLTEEIYNAAQAGRKVLFVSDRVHHCQKIQELLGNKDFHDVGLYVSSIDWDNPRTGKVGKKKITKDQLQDAKKCQVIVATYGMMSEGTDIPELDTLFVGTPRSEIEQVVGRIQRPIPGKKELLIIDPVFQTKWNKSKGKARKRAYKKLGFTEQEG